jgi:glycosyltransferase involved in cell wall biosynthesis
VSFLDRAKTFRADERADVVVHASVIPEPLGLVVLEGMVFGKPVVASCLGGPSETVTPERALRFDPARPRELAAHLRPARRGPASAPLAQARRGQERVRRSGSRQTA